MNKSLEEKLREQRDAMDSLEPSAGLWDKIDQELDQKEDPKTKRLGGGRWYWQAAAVIFFSLSAYLLFDRYQEPPAQMADVLYERLGTDFVEIEQYYGQVISLKRRELEGYSNQYPGISEIVDTDLNTLNEEYKLLEQEFIISNNQAVVDAMIENLRTRIDILSSQIEHLKKLNTTTHEYEQNIEI